MKLSAVTQSRRDVTTDDIDLSNSRVNEDYCSHLSTIDLQQRLFLTIIDHKHRFSWSSQNVTVENCTANSTISRSSYWKSIFAKMQICSATLHLLHKTIYTHIFTTVHVYKQFIAPSELEVGTVKLLVQGSKNNRHLQDSNRTYGLLARQAAYSGRMKLTVIW